MRPVHGADTKTIVIDGVTTRYLEAGSTMQPHLILLHSCEFGACAEISFEYNIAALAQHFHVIAPDWIGYGGSDKTYDFGRNPLFPRLRQLQRLLAAFAIEEADFIGNSCAASFLLQWMSEPGSDDRRVLPVRKMVLVSPSSIGTPGPGRQAHNAYDGQREAMRAIVAASFHSPVWPADEDYVERRQQSALTPGHWEAIEAARFRMPGRVSAGPPKPDYSACTVPLLLITGQNDKLIAEPEGAMANGRRMLRNGRFEVFAQSGHCSHIEHADRFNAMALDYLRTA
ncbi:MULTISPECIES: alpha/beta hydrolase [unclassified Beijerinckia]|uniref:alpha/beta fold hydrolase n=1 Tax=unclassified Beijerinckia TaxID=2638183 RepID=UPI00089D7EB0|nr:MULTISPECIES: alpha/beta hydrolase [unclassified Beijerinckia]MDH7797217.1 pimeloyl-ACP methyl ester carboxylesterase [Beijerinckia sp. GAS462]SEC76705.1 Pimeloyl-ACP methyl ester carboxylesterase [Beijerinckia sp. 28-YEA-48]